MLSRNRFTSPYGDLTKLLESTEEHGGYGNVTWKHAPNGDHGHEDHHVNYVNHQDLLKGAAKHSTSDIEREAAKHHAAMDRGDVIPVPKVAFKGGRPEVSLQDAAIYHAAAKRGATMVPVAFHQNDAATLNLHVGETVVPGKPARKLDPNFKYRFNGRGYYAKPSFNKGKCPPGQAVDAGKDACIGGGANVSAPRPEASGPPRPPAGGAGAGNVGGGAPPARPAQPIPVAGNVGGAPPARPAPAAPAPRRPVVPVAPAADKTGKIFDRPTPERRRIPGGTPASYGIAKIDGRGAPADGQGSLAKQAGFRQGSFDWDYIHSHDEDIDHDAVTELAKKMDAAGLKIFGRGGASINDRNCEPFGSAANGVVYGAEPEPDGTPTVYKFDKGDNESRLALLYKNNKELHKVSSLPRYIDVLPGIKAKGNRLPVYVIHREDLADVPDRDARTILGELGRNAWNGKTPHELAAAIENRSITHDEAKARLEEHLKIMEPKFQRHSPEAHKQFKRIADDFRKMAALGLYVCDAHHLNWGVRKSTGEWSVRDAGCWDLTGKH